MQLMIKYLLFFYIFKFELYDCTKDILVDNNIISHRRSNVNYRYFVVQHGDKFKFLGSCTGVRGTSPMIRCLVKIRHKYDFFQTNPNEIIGTAVIIDKNDDYIILVTPFHVVVPQYLLTFNEFVILNIFTFVSILFSCFFKLNVFNWKVLIFTLLYSFLCCTLFYVIFSYCYPLLCLSSFEIETVINNDSQKKYSPLELESGVSRSDKNCGGVENFSENFLKVFRKFSIIGGGDPQFSQIF